MVVEETFVQHSPVSHLNESEKLKKKDYIALGTMNNNHRYATTL